MLVPGYRQISAVEWSSLGQQSHRAHRSNGSYTPHRVSSMPTPDQSNADPNAELRGFEPLRVSLALGALLLGFLLGAY